jgi:serine/threonine-protein kinase
MWRDLRLITGGGEDSEPNDPSGGDVSRGDRISGTQEAAQDTAPGASESSLASIGVVVSQSGRDGGEEDPCQDLPILRDIGLRRGTLIADTYRIVRPLGAGGMGVVTLAHDEALDRDVAIKFVRPELFQHENLRELFCTEARAMARVSHPNVLAVHAFGEHEGTPFFVMEYVDGPTAEQWLERRGGLPDVDEVMSILEQACRGVEAIHAASTVHRDLKPSNLLIDGSLRVAVSDLGVARILEGACGTDPTCIVGSAAYMAPEAALGDDSKPELATRRDVYALGCIAYELLTGRPPFVAPTDMGLMAKHLLEMPPPVSSLRPELPAGYDDVLHRALEKDPQRRWRSVAALRGALERVRSGDEVPARILIADDDGDWRTLLHDALAPHFPEAQIDVVNDGEQAIEAFERNPYSVVLVDLQMPGVDGMKLTAHLRSLDASDHTPIIVMTAAGGPGEWRQLSRIGADAFLVKPVAFEDVAMQIRRTMKSRHRRG